MDRALAVCTGHRCAALLDPDGTSWTQLREAVQAGAGAVLVSTGCPGACAQAPVVAVSDDVHVHRSASSREQVRLSFGRVTWLGPVHPPQVQALCRWLGDPDAARLPDTLDRTAFLLTRP